MSGLTEACRPVPRQITRDGPIVSRLILGGLHHAYARTA